MKTEKVTLQISLSPSDYRHVKYLLSHQISALKNQVDEILLTYDVHKSKGRFSIDWEKNNIDMWDFLKNLAKTHKKINLIKVDYDIEKNKEIANSFFGRNSIPQKDWRGGPFYTYFFGIHAAKYDFVFHLDSDIFLGGLSESWIEEAIHLYKNDEKILFINPLAGPPKHDGTLIGQEYMPYSKSLYHYKFNSMSTRIFLVDKKRLSRYTFKKIRTFKIGELFRALYKGNPPYILPEEFISQNMINNKQYRVDFKGNAPGLWSLHPPYRTDSFYANLPELIKKIENGDVPESQKGYYDIVDELVDWSEAKAKLK
ncbi:hypothetical protein ACQKCH_13510 [Nubsella zeaxanthinifaciens]|uniref:hypothetical protein n=1 Tax=Nubsella zeaxanthinifaciens TaxID=392412 RepID=UPI003D070C09